MLVFWVQTFSPDFFKLSVSGGLRIFRAFASLFTPFFLSFFGTTFFRDSTALSKILRICCKKLRRNKLPKLTTFSYLFQLPHSALIHLLQISFFAFLSFLSFFSFCLFVCLCFCVFVLLSSHHSDQMPEGSQVSKDTLCVQILKWRSLTDSLTDSLH